MNSLEMQLTETLHLTTNQKTALRRLGLISVRDLLFHFPARYEDFSSPKRIADVTEKEHVSITGKVASIKTKKIFRSKIPLVEAMIEDESGRIRCVWFNQPYLIKTLPEKTTITLSGTVHANKKGENYFANPVYEVPSEKTETIFIDDARPRLLPVYPETRGLSSRWFEFAIKKILPHANNEEDALPPEIRTRYNLPHFQKAIHEIHQPTKHIWIEAARKRFAFEEIFLLQLDRTREKKIREAEPSFQVPMPLENIKELTGRLPFALTAAQKKSVLQILKDIAKPVPMARLLEGDVGSGKTLVAVIASLAVKMAGFQTAYMAPTEILARQHFAEFCKHLRHFNATMGLLTSSESKKFPSKIDPLGSTHISRAQLLTWIKDGKIDIVVGTHALIQKTVLFKRLAFVIVDEQHRFGISQRSRLAKKGGPADRRTPHFLSMTATPIPRTLALTMYGDLAISLLDELPPGRHPPITTIVPPHKRTQAYDFIRKNIQAGGQAFIVCPKIDDAKRDESGNGTKYKNKGPANDTKSVTAEYKKLSAEIFPDMHVAMLHGKIAPKEKEIIIRDFRDKKTDILVSTSVIEVGMDIPNASIIVIEGAERFGLASLHQFRGRVGRAGQQAYCMLFTESKNEKTIERLNALMKAKNGFELAEYDLLFRGAGELSGSSQWGISDIAMEALKNIRLVEVAREEAQKLIEEDRELKKYPLLTERLQRLKQQELHFE